MNTTTLDLRHAMTDAYQCDLIHREILYTARSLYQRHDDYGDMVEAMYSAADEAHRAYRAALTKVWKIIDPHYGNSITFTAAYVADIEKAGRILDRMTYREMTKRHSQGF